MKKEKSMASRIYSWILIIILLFITYKLIGIYKLYFFNEFIKAESNIGISTFTRDATVKYNKKYDSYKIESTEQNDAAFYKEIQVKPNTTYKVSCMVKTKNVVPDFENKDGGANICLIEEPEISKSIVGTTDWQKIEMVFNSKNRTSVKIGFRLGGNSGQAKGTAWFSDFKLEQGITSEDTTWNVVCFVFKNISVDINEEKLSFSMTNSDISTIKTNMQKFKNSCASLSKNKMKVNYDIYEIDAPITTISYSEEFGYYFDPYDINQFIEDIVLEKEYDYIFAAVRMGNEKKTIRVNNWIGLGSMDLYGIGFSNIRMPNEFNSYSTTGFSEEVFMHEFLHTLERESKENGCEVPNLHDYEYYGYKTDGFNGLKKWYQDYMNCEIEDKETNSKIGLPSTAFMYKPVHNSNFDFPITINFNKEPENLFSQIGALLKTVMSVFN